MKKLILIIAALIFTPAILHAQAYELACPAGSSVGPNGQTFNPVTNKLRAWLCINDTNGTVTLQGTSAGSTAWNLVTAGTNANVLHVGTGGSFDHTGTGTINASSLTSNTTNPASAGLIRLGKTDLIEWRNVTNAGNNTLGVDGSNNLVYNGSPIGLPPGGVDTSLQVNHPLGTFAGDTHLTYDIADTRNFILDANDVLNTGFAINTVCTTTTGGDDCRYLVVNLATIFEGAVYGAYFQVVDNSVGATGPGRALAGDYTYQGAGGTSRISGVRGEVGNNGPGTADFAGNFFAGLSPQVGTNTEYAAYATLAQANVHNTTSYSFETEDTGTGANDWGFYSKGGKSLITNLRLATGVFNDASGYKHKRVTTGSVNATSVAAVNVTWPTAFADASYTVTCSVVESTSALLSLSVVHINSVSGATAVVLVSNPTAGALTGTLNCVGVHD